MILSAMSAIRQDTGDIGRKRCRIGREILRSDHHDDWSLAAACRAMRMAIDAMNESIASRYLSLSRVSLHTMEQRKRSGR